MSDRQAAQQVKNEGVQRIVKDANPKAAPMKLYLVGDERRSGNCLLDNASNTVVLYIMFSVNIKHVFMVLFCPISIS